MSMAETLAALKEQMAKTLGELEALVEDAARVGRPIHEVEGSIWKQVLHLGRQCLGRFLALQGDGDLGETVVGPQGQEWQRLDKLHPRRYVSIFGEFELQRAVYGSREGQKIEF